MKIKQLQARGKEHDPEVIEDYRALYEGGQRFRERVPRFMSQNPNEPDQVFRQRKREAHYRSYIGTVVDYFVALLFSTPVIYKATRNGVDVDQPEWFARIRGDADGTGTDFIEFLRQRMVDAMVARCGYLMLDFPELYGKSASKADAEREGALDVTLRNVPAESLVDVGRDRRRKITWAIIHSVDSPRETPEDSRAFDVHTWTVLTAETIREYAVKVDAGARPDENKEAQLMRELAHGLGAVPLVELNVGKGLWIANRLESPQLEHFRLSSANNWSIRRTCYAMPVMSLKDPERFQKNQVMGAGYFLLLGLEEKVEWAAPPTAHIEATQKEVKSQKDEIFRLVTQMSLGVENNAAAIGRSAESKTADADSLQVTLRTYGGLLRDTIRQTLNLLSKARGDDIEWQVEGLDKFDTLPPEVLLELLTQAQEIGIPSKTFQTEVKHRAAVALIPGIDDSTKETIRAEIAEAIESQDEELGSNASNEAPENDNADDEQDDTEDDAPPSSRDPIA